MEYAALEKSANRGAEVTREDLKLADVEVVRSDYAYLISWNDYNSPALLWILQKRGVNVLSAFKPFSLTVEGKRTEFDFGTLVIPVSR